jgi:hypothetical protein
VDGATLVRHDVEAFVEVTIQLLDKHTIVVVAREKVTMNF